MFLSVYKGYYTVSERVCSVRYCTNISAQKIDYVSNSSLDAWGKRRNPDDWTKPLHRADFAYQPTIPSHIYGQKEYYAFLDSRAYKLELKNSFQNGLSYKQHIWLQNKVQHYSNIAGVSAGTLPNYTILQWLKSLLFR